MFSTSKVRSLTGPLKSAFVRDVALDCGFSLAGIARSGPAAGFPRFDSWQQRGLAGEMRYLTDHRAQLRRDASTLLEGCRSVICVGLIYNGPQPYSTDFLETERAWISRYAWGDDYHRLMREMLERLARRLFEFEEFEWRACVDTAPLLERSLAHSAGLGWIGRNTCLIDQRAGSWFFLGELLTTIDLAPDSPAPDRCGTCMRCIEACPTEAIVPSPDGGHELDARLCISYFTIELRGAVPEARRAAIGNNVFGCDICQDVCPWNRRRVETEVEALLPRSELAPELDRLAALSETEFRDMFRGTPVTRAKYSGFLRNVAIAMGNSRAQRFREPLGKLAKSEDEVVAEHARWALAQLNGRCNAPAAKANEHDDAERDRDQSEG